MIGQDEVERMVGEQQLTVLSYLRVSGAAGNAVSVLVFLGESGVQWQPKWNADLPGGSLVVFTACQETAQVLIDTARFEGIAHARGAGTVTVPKTMPYEVMDGCDMFPGIVERLIDRVLA